MIEAKSVHDTEQPWIDLGTSFLWYSENSPENL